MIGKKIGGSGVRAAFFLLATPLTTANGEGKGLRKNAQILRLQQCLLAFPGGGGGVVYETKPIWGTLRMGRMLIEEFVKGIGEEKLVSQ